MVQRKLTSKLCIPKTENLNSENRSGKLRPPSPRFQDNKIKVTEMKKKMKRLKSTNRSTIESCLKTPSFTEQAPQPGKPPTDEKQNKKQAPNYMKSTSSFEARKEQSQVSSQSPVKSPKKDLKNSKTPTQTLTRTTSLKKVRTLTKTPSFKPTRAANKKCQKVVLCKDSNSQKATCSSTLKDIKFPNYLKLSHGSTESEGTSLMKVCPYTYCSLNGHRHTPLPPLKSFLSAKRRVLKTQKNIKLGCLSPRRTKPSGDLEREVSREMVADEKSNIQEPRVQEEQMDFYIEIYVDNRENETPNFGYGFENNLCNYSEVMKTDAELFPQDKEIKEEAMEINSLKAKQETETTETLSNQGEMELNATDSDSYDMEWEKDGYDYEKSSLENGVSMESVEYEEPNSLLANEQEYSGEPQLEKTYEDYISIESNTQVFENDVTHEVIVDDFLAEDSTDSEDQTHPEPNKEIIATDEINSDIYTMKIASNSEKDETQKQAKTAYTRGKGCSSEDLEINTINLQITKHDKSEDILAKERGFNPREPNYLPITPDPEMEKVDLRHQDLDDRKNSDEWMIDYALQQTVTKLAPARKRKVALLVEAFEKVIPPHYEPRLKHTSSAFSPIRPIQACS